MTSFLACAQDMWRPHLGDPTPGGLALTALYVVASVVFLRALVTLHDWRQSERLLWTVSTVILLLLTFNKQLDLQQYLNFVARCTAKRDGWLESRALWQRTAGATVLLLLLAGATWLFWRCRAALAANRPLILGFVLMGLFIALEVARFEALLGNLGERIERLRLHRILEGLALLALIRAGWLRARRA